MRSNNIDIVERMKMGNTLYVNSIKSEGDISPEIRKETMVNGQHPYAIVITCSDSRVIPESIFSAGIGELFVIRVAGNVIDRHQLGSIEYAASHLNSTLVVVLGHTHCGAVGAAIEGHASGFVQYITNQIKDGIGDEKDPYKACCLNVRHSMEMIGDALKDTMEAPELVGAIYDIETGVVEWMDIDFDTLS